MLVYLIGFMGSGKTHYGKELARILNYKFMDLDKLIEKACNQSINELFEEKGENYFRNVEKEVLNKTLKLQDTVVASGGGTPAFFDNMENMNKAGFTVYLKPEIELIIERLLRNFKTRPLLKNKSAEEIKQFVHESIKTRNKEYSKAKLIISPTLFQPKMLGSFLKK